MKVAVFHNVLWSNYKADIFSSLAALASVTNLDISFHQIAETEGQRTTISAVDYTRHQYQYTLYFRGAYEDSNRIVRTYRLARAVFVSDASLVILPGYHYAEYWAMLLVALARRRKIGVFCDSSSYDTRQVSFAKRILKKFFFKHCDVIFAYGKRTKDYLLDNGARSSSIVEGCQASIVKSDWTPGRVQQARAKRRAERRSNSLSLLFVGRLAPEKDLETLFRAIADLRILDSLNCQLDIVGSGPKLAELNALVAELGLETAVNFHGGLTGNELAAAYVHADALLLPSKSEPWGLVVNEALALGCPVIVSDVCGCVPELVIDGTTGFTFPVGNVKVLADRIRQLHRSVVHDVDWTTSCIEHIAAYTPQKAAQRILDGISFVYGRKH